MKRIAYTIVIVILILLCTSCTGQYNIDEETTVPNVVLDELKNAEPIQEYVIHTSNDVMYRFNEDKVLVQKIDTEHWADDGFIIIVSLLGVLILLVIMVKIIEP